MDFSKEQYLKYFLVNYIRHENTMRMIFFQPDTHTYKSNKIERTCNMQTEYVLITPAKNEESKIQKTLESVIKQSILPKQWVIVNDGSTDCTEEIIKSYSQKYNFIIHVNNDSKAEREFSSKVKAFNKGYQIINNFRYSFLGNLDADVSFEPTYYEQILNRMSSQPKLGIAGGLVHEVYNGKTKAIDTSLNSVSGAVQFFRKECFEGIGGYIPIKTGGIDSAAEICARACGWEVTTFTDLTVLHQGRVLTGKKGPLHTMFQKGLNCYMLGYHPFFQFTSSIRRMKHHPFLIGGLFSIFGYIYGVINKKKIILTPETVNFLRKEQMIRLRNFFPL